ncbi:amidohydrolase family protein [Amycolatopsis sp. YIM 10]|uniref:amidohydrolase family protein n=1 Tax=Amycolatopsis sp. YIM 10 TaxID=2653857 RepID=UPI0012901F51|nr:amidohydrolase family protein [Amycolatopsis sp. YIM 10]QFU91166.1 hydroxydechloroatrazine ethylaminohydrolase [Amycolatopsis sp. YIM 10]
MCHLHAARPSTARTLGRRAVLAGAGGLLAAGALTPVATAAPRVLSRTWAVVGATVFDGVRQLSDATVVIRGDRVLRVGRRSQVTLPPGTDVIDGRGRFVLPGLIDAHQHLGGATVAERAANLSSLLGFGYTTVFDPFTSLADLAVLKAHSAAPDAPSPRYLGTGPMLGSPGGWGDFNMPETTVVVTGPDHAFEVVDRLADAGVDAIKAANDDWFWGRSPLLKTMPVDTQAAIVAAARRRGLKVFFHAPSRRLAAQALEAGAAGLLHGVLDEPVDQDFLRLLDRTGASYVSTMMIFEVFGDLVGTVGRQQAYDRRGLVPAATYDALRGPDAIAAVESTVDPAVMRSHVAVLRANAAPVSGTRANVAFGTDGGSFGEALGIAGHVELVLNGEAGLSPLQVLRGATLGAARMLGRHDLGCLAPGKLADLVILPVDPFADLANLHFIDQVVRGGRLFNTTDLRAAR